jgi:hypothetical protein
MKKCNLKNIKSKKEEYLKFNNSEIFNSYFQREPLCNSISQNTIPLITITT